MVEIKGKDYKVSWDALSDIEWMEQAGIKYLQESMNLREMFGMNGREDQKIPIAAMKNMVHFCREALRTGAGTDDYPFEFRELYNLMHDSPKLTNELMSQVISAYTKAHKLPEDTATEKKLQAAP